MEGWLFDPDLCVSFSGARKSMPDFGYGSCETLSGLENSCREQPFRAFAEYERVKKERQLVTRLVAKKN
ncbi:MAG: hypothetical protein LLG09_01700 [Negativicutes bacterium]|nr:hypothetical protein [Negativicutes bacterium]